MSRKRRIADQTIEEMAAEVAKVAIAYEVKKGKPSRALKRICKAVEEIERKERVRTTVRKRGAARGGRAAKGKHDATAASSSDAWMKVPIQEVPTEERGKYNTFFEIADAYRRQLVKFKNGGCNPEKINPLVDEVRNGTSAWIRRVHPEYVQYFMYQFCEWCRDAMIERTADVADKAVLAAWWKKILSPRVYPPWERPLDSPMPRWPRRA